MFHFEDALTFTVRLDEAAALDDKPFHPVFNPGKIRATKTKIFDDYNLM